MYKLRRKLLSQNFLYNRKLIGKLLGRSSVGNNDLVLEIGPGNGIITEQLVQKARHVLAVELDSRLYLYLQNKFRSCDKITLYNRDFLTFRLPHISYKVFANIPFAIEGKIIRKLIDAENPPEDCYLIMMKELAYRLAAPYKENLFSLQHKPWFTFSIYHHFDRTDFRPVPSVDIVMFRFEKKELPLIPVEQKSAYQTFVQRGFGYGQPAFHNLKRIYGYKLTLHAFVISGVRKNTKPAFISLEQWIGLYRFLVFHI
jgi:23S rRNA (adenine-N6)-dimethyltransferase